MQEIVNMIYHEYARNFNAENATAIAAALIFYLNNVT